MDLPDTTVCFYCADQNPHRDRSRGITSYSLALMRSLQAREVILEAVVSKSSFSIPTGIRCLQLPFRTDGAAGRLLADHSHPFFPFTEAKKGHRLWHYPKGFLPLARQVAAPRVGTIADMILPYYFNKYPTSRHPLAFAYWLKVLKHSIERLDAILTVSDFSARAIADFAQRHRLRCPPIINTYEGVEAPGTDLTKSSKGNYVLHLASTLPHKGTVWLLEKWRQFQEAQMDLPALVLVGEVDPPAQPLLASLKHVTLHAPLPRSALEKLIAEAQVLLLPSEVEGFGLPAVEAYLCGTPTAYVRGTAVEEVLGAGTPGGFEMGKEPDSLRHAVAELLSTTREQIDDKAVELRQRFHWDTCAEKTLAAYRSVLG